MRKRRMCMFRKFGVLAKKYWAITVSKEKLSVLRKPRTSSDQTDGSVTSVMNSSDVVEGDVECVVSKTEVCSESKNEESDNKELENDAQTRVQLPVLEKADESDSESSEVSEAEESDSSSSSSSSSRIRKSNELKLRRGSSVVEILNPGKLIANDTITKDILFQSRRGNDVGGEGIWEDDDADPNIQESLKKELKDIASKQRRHDQKEAHSRYADDWDGMLDAGKQKKVKTKYDEDATGSSSSGVNKFQTVQDDRIERMNKGETQTNFDAESYNSALPRHERKHKSPQFQGGRDKGSDNRDFQNQKFGSGGRNQHDNGGRNHYGGGGRGGRGRGQGRGGGRGGRGQGRGGGGGRGPRDGGFGRR